MFCDTIFNREVLNMKKKILLLTTLAVASITLVSAGVVSLFANEQYKVTAGGDTNDYTIIFTAEDVYNVTPDSGGWMTYFDLFKEDAIVVGSNKYDIQSQEYVYDDNLGTNVMGDVDNVKIKSNNHIVEIESSQYEAIEIGFTLVERATIDLDKSVLQYQIDDNAPVYLKITDGGEYGTGYHYYSFSFDLYSNYGSSLVVDSVKLVFSCTK